MPLAPGTRVGPYEVGALLGQGGMGEVYRATDTNLKRPVALKVLPEAVAEDAERLARFQREAEVLASLNHPNIAHIYGLEKSSLAGQAGVTALVMELVEGPTLADWIAHGPIPLDDALPIARQIAEALEAAHGRGIIHRDLKPANVKVRNDGAVKVLDFGLAKSSGPFVPSPDLSDTPTATSPVGRDPAWPTMTERGVILGTAPYMSPEQARGKAVDKRTDIWSFGCVLFEMLSGRRPFQGATLPDILVAVLSKEPDWSLVAGAPAHVVRLLRHCLQKDAKRRLRDIGDAELELAPDSGEAARVTLLSGPRRMWPLAVLAVAALAVAGTLAWRWSSDAGSGEVIWRARSLVTSSSEESDSRISPDGQWISFLSSAGGTTQLLVQRIDGGEVRRVAVPSGQVLSQVWSPDGSRLAYAVGQGESTFVQVVPAFFGGVPSQSIALQPAPNEIALLRWIGQTIYVQAQHNEGRSLERIDLNSNQVSNVSQGWTAPGRRMDFDVSPDGAAVAFSALNGGQEDLWVANLDGTSARQLTNDQFFDNQPMFAGQSTIIFRSNRGGQIDLWQVDVPTGRFQRLTSSQSDEQPESATPGGTLVSFRQISVDSNLFAWDPSRTVLTEVTDDALSDFAPTATADGAAVVFQRSRPSPVQRNPLTNSTLFLGAFDGLRFRAEPTAVTEGYAARLSPDGSRVAYLRRGSDVRNSTLSVKHLGSGDTVTLSPTCPEPSYHPSLDEWVDQNLAWNASGTDLYFVDRSDVYVVRRYTVGSPPTNVPLAAAQQNEIIHDLHPSASGALAYIVRSANGSVVHFIDGRSGATLSTVPIQGTVSARGWLAGDAGLVLARAVRFQPDFTADVEVLIVSSSGAVRSIGVVPDAFVATTRLDPTRSVLFIARIEAGSHNLFEMSLVTGRLRQITDNALPGVTFSGIQPLRGGAMIGVRHQRRSDIWLLDATAPVQEPAAGPAR